MNRMNFVVSILCPLVFFSNLSLCVSFFLRLVKKANKNSVWLTTILSTLFIVIFIV